MALEHSEVAVQQTNGAARTQDTIGVENPATGEVIAVVENDEREQVQALVSRARARPARLGGARVRGART